MLTRVEIGVLFFKLFFGGVSCADFPDLIGTVSAEVSCSDWGASLDTWKLFTLSLLSSLSYKGQCTLTSLKWIDKKIQNVRIPFFFFSLVHKYSTMLIARDLNAPTENLYLVQHQLAKEMDTTETESNCFKAIFWQRKASYFGLKDEGLAKKKL